MKNAVLVVFACALTLTWSALGLESNIVVSASSHDGNVPENTLDGSTESSSRWSAIGDGQWIQYDFGAEKIVAAVEIAFQHGTSRVQYFDVLVGSTPDNLRLVFSGASSGKDLGMQRFSFPQETARYLRIVGHGNSSSAWNSLTEVDFVFVAPPVVSTKYAVTASTHDGNPPENTLDGSTASGSRWSAYGVGQWIEYDLAAVERLDGVDIAFQQGDTRVQYFDILLAAIEGEWQTVYSGQSSGDNLDLQRFSFPVQAARYVRIVGQGNSSSAWNSLTEVDFSFAPIAAPRKIQVTASDHDGNAPENTLDGSIDSSSRWSAEGDGQWLHYDLGDERVLTAVDVAFQHGDQRYQYFDIHVAGAEGDWLQVFSGSSNGKDLDLQRFGFDAQSVRYICITGHGNSQSKWNSLTEVDFLYSGSNGVTVSSSGDDGNVAANTIDGSTSASSRWSAYGDGQWIQYDLGGERQLEAVDIAFYSGTSRVQYFEIQVATTQVDWRTVYSGGSSGKTLDFQRFAFEPQQARYVRIIGHGNSTGGWNSLTEVSFAYRDEK